MALAFISSAYCERLDGAFWGEPLNALSNGAFLFAALAVGGRLRVQWRRGVRDWPALLLTATVAAISFGSFLFHTRPGPMTALADVIPIQVFVLAYLVLAFRRFLGFGLLGSGLGAALLAAASLSCAALPGDVLNGSASYLPALAALFGLGFWLLARARRSVFRLALSGFNAPAVAQSGLKAAAAGRSLLLAGSVFLISLFFRTIDRAACLGWPSGSHWIWHLLNALVLFLLLRAAMRDYDPVRGEAG